MPASAGAIPAIASTPRSAREPCAARPSVSSCAHTKPLCATQAARCVGSVTTQASARQRRRTDWTPSLACSSSATAVTITSPLSPSRAAAAPATMIAARPPFMS